MNKDNCCSCFRSKEELPEKMVELPMVAICRECAEVILQTFKNRDSKK